MNARVHLSHTVTHTLHPHIHIFQTSHDIQNIQTSDNHTHAYIT